MSVPLILRLSSVYHALVVAIVTSLAFAISREIGFAVGTGGVISWVNFVALHQITRGIMQPAASAWYAAWFVVKIAVLFALVTAALSIAKLEPVGVVAGLATMVLGVGMAVIHVALSPREPNAEDARWSTD